MTEPAEAMRQYRSIPENRMRSRQIVKARSAALTALAALHPDEYERLCNEQRARVGLPALRERTGRPPMRLRLVRDPRGG